MKNMRKKHIVSAAMMALALLLPGSGFAQTTIGSWQTSSDDGWIDWGNGLSITDVSNTNKYGFAAGVVSGYAQSLKITQSGWNQSLSIKLQNNGYVDDFTNNNRLTFTFSVPAWTNGGYSQLDGFTVNAPGVGFASQAFDGRWSATGSTNNNSGTKPVFNFWDGSPARTQTVTFDYSSLFTSLTPNPGYVELIFTFNNGGGAPAFWYMNNVVLSSTNTVNTNVVVLYPFNETNSVPGEYYPWSVWFGDATDVPAAEWDASDAGGDANSGSMKINAFFPDSGYGYGGWPQFVVHNDYNGLELFFGTNGMPCWGNTMTDYVVTNISFDLRFDPASAYVTNSGNWPGIEIGTRGNTNSFSQFTFGTATIPQSQTNWVHFSIPIGANADWASSYSLFFKHYSAALAGPVNFYVDNIAVTRGVVPRPILSLEQAKPGLRVFAGSSGIYDRQQLNSVNTNQSWVGGSYPVSYSFTLSDYGQNPPLGQVHLFLIPVDHINGGLGNINQYTDYSYASNNVWLQIIGGTSNVTANIAWKTNKPNANPDHVALQITNATAVGEWKLTFNNASSGTLTAPGASPVGFTITNANMATDFDNPLMVFCGIQPNYAGAIGQHVDYAKIQTAGVASPGVPINTDFTSSGSIDTNVWRTSASVKPSSLVPVSASKLWWLSWNYSGAGTLTTKADLGNGSVAWKTPGYFTGQTGTVFQAQMGPDVWTLLPQNGLPTTDGTSNGIPGSAAFFRLDTSAPAE